MNKSIIVENNGKRFEDANTEYLYRCIKALENNLEKQSCALAQLHTLLCVIPSERLKTQDQKRINALKDTTAHYIENINSFADYINHNFLPKTLDKIYTKKELIERFKLLYDFINTGIEKEEDGI